MNANALEVTSRAGALRSSKILDLHLDRLAVVYVGQSDPQQVLNHRESRERHYALADHAAALGWPRDRVLVIDDDQGQIKEFEHVNMRNRIERGRLHKAQRGELFHRVPTGYVKLSTELVELDPDEQVREVIRLIFDKYDEIGTAWGVFHDLIRNNIKLGFRPFHGPERILSSVRIRRERIAVSLIGVVPVWLAINFICKKV